MCNKLLSLLMLVFVIGGVAVAGTAEPNLLAFYRFDETSGTTAHDYSGNGYNGTVGSSSGWDSSGFYGNGCLDFNGTFNVQVPDDVVSGLFGEVTVSVWVKSDNPGTYSNALFWGVDSSHNRVLGVELPGGDNSHLWFNAGYSRGVLDTYTYYYISNAVTFRGQWNNFTFTKDTSSGEMKIYVNGFLIGTATGKTRTMANIVDFKIGTSWDGSWAFQGKMADFKIFDRALSAAEISEQAGNSLVGWWKFEETSGTVAHDNSSYRHDGTLGNNNSWDGGVVMTGDNWGGSKVGFTSADASEIFSTVDDQITIAFWAKNDFANCSGNNGLFTGKNSSGTILLRLEQPAANDALVFKAGSDDVIYYFDISNSNSHNYLDMEHWHHYVLVKDAARSYMKVYIDGYLAANITERYSWDGGGNLDASMAGIVNFELCGSSSDYHEFAGTVRDFRIYDTALEPLDVRDVYNQYAPEFNNTYYVDAVNGNDSYSGTSPAAAWKTISKLNATTFQPLDRILLKARCTWTGAWTLNGSGNPGEPIVVDAYGGDVSNILSKPQINNTDTWAPTINANNVEWWEVNNLHVTHHPAVRTQWISAVRIYADNFGKMNHIHIKDCYIHDVYGLLEGYGAGQGISLSCNESGTTESWLNDILIEGCYFETIDTTAIQGGSNLADGDRQPATHVVVRDNFFTDIGESGIVLIGNEGALVEYNVLTNCFKRGNGGCGIWPWNSNNTIVQYNEVYGCDDRGDGEAYDCDYQCDGTIFQYNYSHDNPGGFMRICSTDEAGGYNTNNIIRYNISINDGDYDDAVIELWRVCSAQIYNNIIYLENKGTVNLVGSALGDAGGACYNWWNNIWVAGNNSTGRFAIADGSTNYFSYNCFYGDIEVGYHNWLGWHFNNGTPSDPYKITSDPKFVNPGEHGVGSSLTGYQLQSTSPCIGTGLNISNNGGLDYWGNNVPYGTTDRGAHERQ